MDKEDNEINKEKEFSKKKDENDMSLTLDTVEQFQEHLKSKKREEIIMHQLTIEQIENQLGFNQIKPIIGLTPSEEKTLSDDADIFEKLYNEELKDYYAKYTK